MTEVALDEGVVASRAGLFGRVAFPSSRSRVLPWPRASVLAVVGVLFVVVGVLRFVYNDPGLTISTFCLVPIAILAMEFGLRGGVLGATASSAMVVAWVLVLDVDVGTVDVVLRCLLLVTLGVGFGLLGDRLSQAVSDRAAIVVQGLYTEELEARVEGRTSELAGANKELEAFSYSIAHDLRAPLRAIDGYSHAVLEDYEKELPEGAKADLARVRAASQRMSTLIDELLGLSRITRRELVRAPVDMSVIAREIAGEMRSQESGREVQIDIEAGLRVIGDPELLRLVLQNLIENAWKFTAQTEAAHVELSRVGRADGHSTFAVRDNGAGFDMRYAEKLFRPFERLHRHEEYSGTGVGLTTVARVLNRHGGRIWAEGTPGAGAVFFFDLPTREGQDEH